MIQKRNDIGNIYWEEVKSATMMVVDTGKTFIAMFENGDYKLINWDSQTSKTAQQWLTRLSRRDKLYHPFTKIDNKEV